MEKLPVATTAVEVGENERGAAINRLHNAFSAGELSHERLSGALEEILAASTLADLETAMLTLPPLVRRTPTSQRLTKPLVLQSADGSIQLGCGWQLAADTTIRTGLGTALVDLATASWDAHQISLHLETWGSIDVLVPEGVAVQMVGGRGTVHLESLSSPVAGGPILRISTSGPTGVIRIHHPGERNGGWFTRWRRSTGRPRSGRQ